MSTIEVLIISAVLSALAFLAGLKAGYRIGVKVGIISAVVGFTTMTETNDAPVRPVAKGE